MNETLSVPAPLWRRLAAFLYDSMVLIAVLFVYTAVLVMLNQGESISHPAYYFSLYGVSLILHCWFYTHGGQTLGMQAWRIRMRNEKGDLPNWKQALLHYLFGTLLFAICYLPMLLPGTRLAWHDRLSGNKILF